MTEQHDADGAPVEGAPEGANPEAARPDAAANDAASQQPTAAASGDGDSGGESGEGDELFVDDILAAAEAEAADPTNEHLADLKRITAEYANYRKRTEANRVLERERAIGEAVKVLLPVLDDLDRAEKHGDLVAETPFATIAAKLRASVEKLGLSPFGTVGEAFDPQLHEAIFQQPVPGAETERIAEVVETGYNLGSTLLRPARVVVTVPA